MSARSYWVGLPVGITVHDDGTLQVEVDMSEATAEMVNQWAERSEGSELENVSEAQVLTDCAVVNANPNRSSGTESTIAPAVAELSCHARWDCPFRTFSADEMLAHVSDPAERHGDA